MILLLTRDSNHRKGIGWWQATSWSGNLGTGPDLEGYARATTSLAGDRTPGKPDGIDGSQVEAYFNASRVQRIADYCKSDVINTYRLWLRHELFRGRLDQNQFQASERDVQRFAQCV
jgi:Predicted 3'-5' exonuclease related to the exonuclease domain of PolB